MRLGKIQYIGVAIGIVIGGFGIGFGVGHGVSTAREQSEGASALQNDVETAYDKSMQEVPEMRSPDIAATSKNSSQSVAGASTPAHQNITATVYWIGEGESADNDSISNVPSAWSSDTIRDFGGIDTANGRKSFTPKHNSYYVALPANEFDQSGIIAGSRSSSPWKNEQVKSGESLFKGRWVKIMNKSGKAVYAQWHDTGPCGSSQPACLKDYAYVFGSAKPINTFGLKAGIDLSPDAASALNISGSGSVSWEFVEASAVPVGPWKTYPAITNKVSW